MKVRIGFHLSMAGGIAQAVRNARKLGCTAMQIFPGNPRGWGQKPLDHADAAQSVRLRRQHDIGPLVVHLPYLANLASPDKKLHEKSVRMLSDAMGKCALLEADFLNTHVGSSRSGSPSEALSRVAEALNRVLKSPKRTETVILLENTAGGGTELGSTFEELARIIRQVRDKKRIGVCLDTAHLFGKGWDLRRRKPVQKMFQEFDRSVGREYLKLIHFNDSRSELGSLADRHHHIGKGKIGNRGMKEVIRIAVRRGLPLIMETPSLKTRDDRNNLKRALGYLSRK